MNNLNSSRNLASLVRIGCYLFVMTVCARTIYTIGSAINIGGKTSITSENH